MRKIYAIIFLLSIVKMSVSQVNTNFETFADFKETLQNISEIEDLNTMTENLNQLWNHLTTSHLIPFAKGDSVMFLFRGNNSNVFWAGDFNGWANNDPNFRGTKFSRSDLWTLTKVFPADSRLDYKIIADNNWILDPHNPFQQMGGFCYNSELRMPEWKFPHETLLWTGVQQGTLSSDILIHSQYLGYDVNYRVYIPYNYETQTNLPVLYVTDGHEYANPAMGALLTVADNLIYTNKIVPIIIVFIDPRDPHNLSNNRRATEYVMNPAFANFVALELVAQIDQNYRTNTNPDFRAILGTSLGGLNSAYFAVQQPTVFHLIGIHSPAFYGQIFAYHQNANNLPIKIFMSTGVIFDTENPARAMKEIFVSKNYPLQYVEVNEGHSWGNWRALLNEPLGFFFGTENFDSMGQNKIAAECILVPNPTADTNILKINLLNKAVVSVEIYNSAGLLVSTTHNKTQLTQGEHNIVLFNEKLNAGVYFVKIIINNEVITKKLIIN